MGKLFLASLAVVALVVFLANRGGVDRSAFGKCIEKEGVVVADSSEFSELTAEVGMHPSLGEELDKHSLSLQTPDSSGLALITQSEDDARNASDAFEEFNSSYTMQRSGNVVVAWMVGPDERAAAAVRSCGE
jgi:hypothetical protein